MKNKSLIRLLLAAVLLFGFSSAWAKNIKWSMAGDSLTLDPHAQNEGPNNTSIKTSIRGISKLEALICKLDLSLQLNGKL